ncbi:7TMR-DISM family protein [Marinomonas transparens]|uniref:7TMR-DISM extracellular 2 n=1 Tax=Marinomonas transparens TaxID=2795388 RepID=A0A934N135_9GAMM|nr:7TM-DISM domain-containing protein [Marinomonas transparens]MBJ7539140.1 hypothetical protein [Marinomonas transparens]
MFYRLILLFLLTTSNLAWSADRIAIIDDSNSSFNIGQSGFYLIDNKSELSFDAVTSEKYAKRFLPINKDFLQLGIIQGNIWIRTEIAVRTSQTMPVLLEVNSPRLQYLDVYLPTLYQDQIQAKLGEARPYSNRLIENPNFLFPLPSNAPPVFTIYIRLSSYFPINAEISIKTFSQLSVDSQKSFALTGLLIGTLFVLFLSNVFFFIRTSHPMYLLYGVVIIGIIMLHLAFHGRLGQFLPNELNLQERIYNFTSLACTAALVLFSRLYLNSKHYFPRFDKLLIAVGIADMLLAFFFALAPDFFDPLFLSSIAFFSLILLTILAIAAAIKSIPFSGYYLMARLSLFTGYTIWLMVNYGIIANMTWLQWGLTTAILIEAVTHFLGMIAQTTPPRKGYPETISHYSKTENIDLLSDLSSRLRRQINVINGGLSHIEKNALPQDSDLLLKNSLVATNNLKSLTERIDYIGSLKDRHDIEQKFPIFLNDLIDKAYENFQSLDQDNTLIELNLSKTDHVEILQNAEILQHLLQVIMQEFKHFTDQALAIDIKRHELYRDGLTYLEINCQPLPSRIHINEESFDLGLSYISLLIRHLDGKADLLSNHQLRRFNIQIPIRSHIRHLKNDAMQQNHYEMIVFGQEDHALQQTLSLLQNRSSRIEHFTSLDALLNYLENPEKRSLGAMILIFDNGGHIPHITQQKVRPLMQVEDQCLLVTENVKMSRDYARTLGFDELLASSEINDKLESLLSMLIRKGDRLKSTSTLSRINPLQKEP